VVNRHQCVLREVEVLLLISQLGLVQVRGEDDGEQVAAVLLELGPGVFQLDVLHGEAVVVEDVQEQ